MMRPILGKKTNLKIANQEITKPQINVFPNPSAEQIYFSGLDLDGPVNYEIFSSMGKKMQSGIIVDQSIKFSFTEKGLFYIRLNLNHENISFRVLKN